MRVRARRRSPITSLLRPFRFDLPRSASNTRTAKRRRRSARSVFLERLEDRRLLSVNVDDLWQLADLLPEPQEDLRSTIRSTEFETYTLDVDSLQSVLNSAPLESSPAVAAQITLPDPHGQLARFDIVESPIMAPELAAKFPEIKTYRGQGVDDPAATIRFDVNPAGLHAQVLSPQGAYYVDPYYHLDDSLYASYYASRDLAGLEFLEVAPRAASTQTTPAARDSALQGTAASVTSGKSTVLGRSGTQLRTYRTAVAATGEYTTFHGGSVAAGQAAIVTAINRVTGIYETELAIRLQLVGNNSQLVYTNGSTDPYTDDDPGALISENQTNIDSVIGDANYDIGHVFSTGGGGLAGLGVVGVSGLKAQGVTGLSSPTGDPFYVDFVAHEMGHQFGGNHTFNGDSDSCSGNRNASTAYEPGSGSTIQAYAGICADDNLQNNSDPYFHSISFDEIISYVDTSIPTVGTRTATGNDVPVVNAGNDVTVPARTPFTLTATGSDGNAGDVLTYNWEQRDLGPQRDVNAGDNGSSPLFRSWTPTTDPTRTLPRLSDLLNNTTVTGETLPTTTRSMNFRATVRDNRSGGGGVNTDDMLVSVVDTGTAFQVNSPNGAVSWPSQSTQTVTWNVAGTTANGINTSSVNILLSTDSGNTFPTLLAAGTPNDGSEDIVLPNTTTSTARIRVEAVGNIFFDISDTDFAITSGANQTVVVMPSKDNTLFESGTGSLSNGQGQFLYAGTTATSLWRRALMHFDLAGAGIPVGSTVTSASLDMFVSLSAPGGNTNVSLHTVSADWGEGSSNAGSPGGQGAPATSGDATWLHRFFNTTLWANAGGDFDFAVSAATTVNATGSTATWSSPLLVADVQTWLDAPAGNFGWMLRGNELSTQNARRFNSRENSANPPRLTVTYTSPNSLTLNVAADSISEAAGAGATTATVTRSGDTSGALAVSLASNDTTEAAVQASVTIAAGQTTSPPFNIDAIDDAVVDGTQTVTLTASATGLTSGSDTVDVTDDEVASLSLVIAAASISESAGAGATTATVTRTGPTGSALVVSLASNDATEATVQAAVTIAAGQATSPPFNIDAIDDAIVDGTQTVTLTASATGFTAGLDTVDVTDDELPGLSLLIAAASISEAAGAGATTATVSRTGPTSSPLVVSLASNDTTEASVQAAVTIAAGQATSPPFNIDAIDDAIVDGTQTVTLTASATGFTAGLDTVDVTDDELPGLSLLIAAASISEAAGAGATTATVSRTGPTSSPLVVSLASDDTTEAAVQASVTIAAGQATSPPFNINAIDDAIFDGTQTVTITGSASGFTAGTDTVDVVDDDPPVLTLTIVADSISEGAGAGATTATVSRNTDTTNPLVVGLVSSDTTEATVQPSVTIAAGQTTSLPFNIDAVDDAIVDGTQTALITASAVGHVVASDSVDVTDDDAAALLSQPATSVIAFSSQWSPTTYSAAQTLGVANVFTYGDSPNAWSANVANGTTEFLTLGFATPVFASGITVRESWGNGFVTGLEVRSASTGAFATVFSGVDPSAQGSVVDFLVNFAQTAFMVDAIRVSINTSHSSVWEEVDSVLLHGVTTPPPAGITVNPTTGLFTSESGTTATFTVVLDTVPSANVTVGLSSSDATEGAVSPAVLTFTPSNALIPQTVTITGVDDALVDGDIGYTIVTAAALSGDTSYNAVDAADVSVTNTDNDGVSRLSQPAHSMIAFSSQWSPASYSAAQTLGAANVFTYGDSPNAWSASVANGTSEFLTLGFATPFFASGITVRESWGNGFVTGLEVRNASTGAFTTVFSGVDPSTQGSVVDFLVNFAQTAFLVDAIRVSINTSHSSVWEEVDSVLLHGVTTPPSAGITVDPTTGLSTSESGTTATFTVVLDTVPAANVTVGLNSSDATEGSVSPAALTFTPANALTPQTVTITGVDDVVVDGDIGYTIVTVAAASGDANYNGFDAADVSVTNTDNDGIPLLSQPATSVIAFSSQWSPAGYSAAQTLGAPNVFTYGDSPNAWSANVVNGTTEFLTLGFATPVFASGITVRESWGNGFVTMLEVRNASTGAFTTVFSGVDPSAQGSVVDFLVNFVQTTFLVDAIRVSINTSHSGVWEEVDSVLLHGVTTPPPAGITVNPTTGLSTSESGTTATFTVVLDTVPAANVTIGLSSSDATEGTVSPATLTFTPANALTPQTVTITGVDDARVDGDIPYTIVTAAATSSDTHYNGIDPADVAVTNTDNDGIPLLSQPANSVLAFSSQWSSAGYSAAQTLGAANVFTYGDSPNAWSASVANGTTEFLTLGFATPVFASGITVRESWGNGFVTGLEVRNATTGTFATVFSGVDPSAQGSVVDFLVNFAQTTFLVDAIRVTIDTDHSSVWEEVDSVLLHGVTSGSRSDRGSGQARSAARSNDAGALLGVVPPADLFGTDRAMEKLDSPPVSALSPGNTGDLVGMQIGAAPPHVSDGKGERTSELMPHSRARISGNVESLLGDQATVEEFFEGL